MSLLILFSVRKNMRWKLFFEFILTVLVLFIIGGDLLLPQPYRSESQQLKSNINHFLIGLLPNQFTIKIKSKDSKNI